MDSKMKGGIMPPVRHEPEDILSGIPSESTDEQAVPAPMQAKPVSSGDGRLKGVMIALIVIAGILVLAIGGLFVYRTYFMKTEESPLNNAPLPSSNSNQMPTEDRTQRPEPVQNDNSPIVAPTPEPNIPKPTTVSSTNPTIQVTDTDGDGLSDERELELKTDVSNVDTDGDKLNDGEEVSMATDPLIADTDGDGLPDGDEVRVRKTDPKNKDTDGDGFGDGEEIRNGYNPLGEGKLSDFR